MLSGVMLGAIWGILRHMVLRHKAFTLAGISLLVLTALRIAAPSAAIYAVLPSSRTIPSVVDAARKFATDAVVEDVLPSTPLLHACLLVMFAVCAALVVFDTAVAAPKPARSLFRALTMPVGCASIISYKDHSRPLAVTALIGCAALVLVLRPARSMAQRRRSLPEWGFAAAAVTCVAVASFMFVAPLARERVIQPVREKVEERVSGRAVATAMHISFNSPEDAAQWVEQHVDLAAATNGDVSAVLAAGSGSQAQRDALAATLAARGGVDVAVLENGTEVRSLPGLGPAGKVGDDGTAGSAMPDTPSPVTGSPPGPSVGPGATSGTSVTSSTSEAVSAPNPPAPAETEATAAGTTPSPSKPAVTTSSPEPRRSAASSGLGWLWILTTAGLLTAALLCKRRLNRRSAGRDPVHPAIAAWLRVEAIRRRRFKVSHPPSATFRERASLRLPEEDRLCGVAPLLNRLADLADKAAYSPDEIPGAEAERLETEIVQAASRKHP